MIEQQQKLVLSPYMEIYELVIPKDNLLRQIKELVDFSFIYDALLANYTLYIKNVSCAKYIDFFIIKYYFDVKHICNCK